MMDVIFLSLACWRISKLITSETGPARLLERMREWAGVRVEVFEDGSEEVMVSPGSLGELVTCMWCTSVWVGAAATTLYVFSPRTAVVVAMPFFFSAMTVLTEKALSRLD